MEEELLNEIEKRGKEISRLKELVKILESEIKQVRQSK